MQENPKPAPQPDDQLHQASLSRGEATTQLQDVFTPLATEVATVVQATSAGELREAAAGATYYNLPNTDAVLNLPWDIFLGANEDDMAPPPNPDDSLSVSATFITNVMDAYAKRHPEYEDKKDGTVNAPRLLLKQPLEDYVAFGPDSQWNRGRQAFDARTWKAYEQTILDMPEPEQRAYTTFAEKRTYNVTKWDKHDRRIQQADAVLYAHDPEISDEDFFNNIVLPVGEYGLDFTQQLAETTIAINKKTRQVLLPKVGEIAQENKQLLADYTARAAENGPGDEAVLSVMAEGVLSIGQTLALLTAEKVEGYDNPHDLVDDIVKSGLVQKLARDSPMGFVGPMALGGFYFPGALKRTETGLDFGDQFDAYLKVLRGNYVGDFVLKHSVGLGQLTGLSKPLGTMCPVAGRSGGLHELSEAFSTVLKSR